MQPPANPLVTAVNGFHDSGDVYILKVVLIEENMVCLFIFSRKSHETRANCRQNVDLASQSTLASKASLNLLSLSTCF